MQEREEMEEGQQAWGLIWCSSLLPVDYELQQVPLPMCLVLIMWTLADPDWSPVRCAQLGCFSVAQEGGSRHYPLEGGHQLPHSV